MKHLTFLSILAVCTTIMGISCYQYDNIATLPKWQSEIIFVINWLSLVCFSITLIFYGNYIANKISINKRVPILMAMFLVFGVIFGLMMRNHETIQTMQKPYSEILFIGGFMFLGLGVFSALKAVINVRHCKWLDNI